MRGLLAGLVSMALLVSGAAAQEAQSKQGFWLGFGVGGGSNLTSTLDGRSPGGWAGNFRLGGTLSQKWLLGGESAGWTSEVEDETWAFRSNFTAIALFYPSPGRGLFFKAGPGFSMISESRGESTTVDGVTVSTGVSATETGFGATFGAGWEIKIGRNLHLVPEVTWLLQAFEARTTQTMLGEIPGTNNLLLFTVGLTWH